MKKDLCLYTTATYSNKFRSYGHEDGQAQICGLGYIFRLPNGQSGKGCICHYLGGTVLVPAIGISLAAAIWQSVETERRKRYAAILRKYRMVAKQRVKRIWMKNRSDDWWQSIVKKEFTDEDWLENFRVSKATFMYIVHLCTPYLATSPSWVRPGLSMEKKVSIALYKLASCAQNTVLLETPLAWQNVRCTQLYTTFVGYSPDAWPSTSYISQVRMRHLRSVIGYMPEHLTLRLSALLMGLTFPSCLQKTATETIPTERVGHP